MPHARSSSKDHISPQPDLFNQTENGSTQSVTNRHRATQSVPICDVTTDMSTGELSASNTQPSFYEQLIARHRSHLTPMLQQYVDNKEKYPGCLLFFRLGDFYELFFDDAQTASRALHITLTKRGEFVGEPIPMCGVPFHASEAYIKKLLAQGYRIAICEQTETPEDRKQSPHLKGPLSRDVVRIITPGTVVEDAFVEGFQHHYLLSIGYVPTKHKSDAPDTLSCALFDMSTHTLMMEEVSSDKLLDLLARYHVVEMLIPDMLFKHHMTALKPYQSCLRPIPAQKYNIPNAKKRVLDVYHLHTFEGVLDMSDADITALNILIDYISLTQKDAITSLPFPKKHPQNTFLILDHDTRRSLEIDYTSRGVLEGSLFHTLNHTLTRGGARLLQERFACPLQDIQTLEKRLDQITFFLSHTTVWKPFEKALSSFLDMERSLTRILLHKGGPRDAKAIQTSLIQAHTIMEQMSQLEGAPFDIPKPANALVHHLSQALCEEVPHLARDGGFIQTGYHSELDHYRTLCERGHTLILEMQERYQKQTGVNTLKIKSNNVIGYFVECPVARMKDMPVETFVHRQTMANAVRYSTQELNTLAQKLISASVEALALEEKILNELCEDIRQQSDLLFDIARFISILDVSLSQAKIAHTRGYVRPTLTHDATLTLKGGRHPVVEEGLRTQNPHTSRPAFQSNDTTLDVSDTYFMLLTGPNMAGKSTYLRQVALIVFMAQCGFFVPAESAHMGIVDRIFSRIGAGDDLFLGRSTFMVEMVETATILNQATHRSLVILDELGRGTSTYDGVAIAMAVSEYLIQTIGCRTLFATHYFELTQMEDAHNGCVNMRMGIQEDHGRLLFLHTLERGAAEKSYGLHVAALSGVPSSVVKRAYAIAQDLHTCESITRSTVPSPAPVSCDAPPSPLQKELDTCDPNQMTPLQALTYLMELKQKVG